MADRKLIQFVGTDGNEYDVRDEAAQQMIGTTALPTTAQTLTGAIAEHETDLGTKADKVASAVNGNFAGLDGNGNLTDSGSNASDFVPVDREINGKALSTDVTLTGDDITVSAEDEQTVSDAVTELNTAVEAKADQTQVDKIEKELTGKADKDSVFDYKQAVPGSTVEVYDAVAEAVKTMQIEIAPVQDLHGYDKPWVGGAGRNLLPIAANLPVTIQGVEWSIRDDGAILATRKSTSSNHSDLSYADTTLQAGGYVFSCFDSECSPGGSTYQANCKTDGTSHWGTGITSISSESEISVSVVLRVYSGFTGTAIFKPMVRLSTETDATYEPYSNICPISGFTGCEVTRKGKNLIGLNTSPGGTIEYSNVTASDHTDDSVKLTSTNNTYANMRLYYTLPAGTYTVKYQASVSDNNVGVAFYNGNSIFVNPFSPNTEQSFTLAEQTLINIRLFVTLGTATAREVTFSQFQLEMGSSASAYEPYANTAYTITFPAAAGTVYGGTLTVNADGTGTLVVNKVDADLSTLTWSIRYTGETKKCVSANLPENYFSGDSNLYLIAEKYALKGYANSYSVFIDPDSCEYGVYAYRILPTTVSKVLYCILDKDQNPTGKVVYKTESTLTPIHLTAPQIRTILGYNRIYANTGSILSMLYLAERYQTAEQADRERIHAVVDEPSAVVSITDGADNVPMGMQIAIEPVQDLHGQSSPYPAGSGKNLCPDDVSEFSVSGEGWFSLSGVGASTWTYGTKVHLKAGTYKRSFSNLDNITTVQTFDSNGNLMTITSGTIVMGSEGDIYIRIKATGNISLKTQIEEGSTITDWEPYSNICPISGWTGAEISRTGKNLFGDYITNGKTITAEGVISDYYIRSATVNGMRVKPNTTYTLSYTSSGIRNGVFYYKKNGSFLFYLAWENDPRTFTTPEDCELVKFAFDSGTAPTNVQLEEGSTATAYEPYSGQTYSITFPSSAGTVYGGTLTINKNGTGELVADRVKVALSSMSWERPGADYCRGLVSEPAEFASTYIAVDACCSHYEVTAQNGVSTVPRISFNTNKQVYVADYRIGTMSASELPEFFSGVDLVYKLAAPITYTLSAPVIRSLLGNNVVFASTGNVLHLDYTADTKSYIDKTDNRITSVLNAMVAPVLPSMVADTALSVNDFRIVNDTLYRVTASIASGGTLTVGTNVVKTSIGEQIAALLNAN